MSPKTPYGWPVERPRADFAERTVAAIVRDRAGGRTSARPRRLWGALAVAAVLIAGGAWGRAGIPKARRTQVAPQVAPQGTGPNPAVKSPAVDRLPAVLGPASGPRPPPAIPPPERRRYREPTRAPDAGRSVRVPLCNCVQAICDCGEEP